MLQELPLSNLIARWKWVGPRGNEAACLPPDLL
jgi:hypothetical protein